MSVMIERAVKCECYSHDHVVWFELDDCGDVPEFTVSTHLSTWRGFWNRLWNGTKYILGLRQRHGNWDEVCVPYEQAKELRAMLDQFIAMRDELAAKQSAKDNP